MKGDGIKGRFLDFIQVLIAPKILIKGKEFDLYEGFEKTIDLIVQQCVRNKAKIMFIGNGGSAAIASHQAMDFFNNCNIKTASFNDPSLLTCMANDYGYSEVFARPISVLGEKGDILAAISSSGKSLNIIKGVEAAKKKDVLLSLCQALTRTIL
jgi:D-sedoheptulose 7-phosphate isomerase